MNRSQQMDDFLQYWAKIYLQNSSYPVDSDAIYTSLMNYGLTEAEQVNPSIKGNFSAWTSHFQNNPNLLVYHDQRQPAFLQFRSGGNLGDKHVKLYLSYPPDKMEYCVKKIFEYIARNRMVNASTVADRVRSDSIVLRMANYDDAMKVMDFINRDPELVMYAKPTNPFMMRNGKVGVSYDDSISYNRALTMMMAEYFNICRNNNTLMKVNHKDFRDFINAYYQRTFRDSELLKVFLESSEVSRMVKRFPTSGDCLSNYAQVLKLMVMQLDGSMNMERYRSFYVDVKDFNKKSQMVDYYNNLLVNSYGKKKSTEKIASLEEIELINYYLLYATKKYGTTKNAAEYLQKYILDKNINTITRDQDFRLRFHEGMSPERASFIVSGNAHAYIEQLLQPVKEETEATETIPQEEQILNSFIDYARTKYGDAKVAFKLQQYITGTSPSISLDNDICRKLLQIPPAKLQEISNNNIFIYVQNYIQKKNKENGIEFDIEDLYKAFISACVATYQKYGYQQLRSAIENGFNANFVYFTSGNGNYKEKLINVSPNQFKKFCERLLSTYGTEIGKDLDIYDNCARVVVGMSITPSIEIIKTA